MEELKQFLEDWLDPSKRDKAKLKELYSLYYSKDIEDCAKCEARAITDLRKTLHKLETEAGKDSNEEKKYVLKPGNHQFIQGDKLFNNDNLTDENAAAYIKNYPHTKALFDKIP
jgi:hypothetical protein